MSSFIDDKMQPLQYSTTIMDDESCHRKTQPISKSHINSGFFYKSLNWTAVVVAFGGVLGWLVSNYRNMPLVVHLEGVVIGGNLTLSQAKAIDFVSSAILGPLVLACFNVIWFANARRFLADGMKGGINLYSLVEASATTAGSYDLFKIWALITGRSTPFLSFTALVVFSAIGKSALSNIVAYEAFMSPDTTITTNLRLLTDPDVAASIQTWNRSQGVPQVYNFNRHQTAAFASNVSSLLQTVAWQNASKGLIDGVYIAPNITSTALQDLDSTFSVLEDVPAIRASINCNAYSPDSLNATNVGDSSSWIIEGPGQEPFFAMMPGYTSNFISIATGYEGVSFMGFSAKTDDVFIGVLFPDGPFDRPFPTNVGNMTMRRVNGIVNGKQYTNETNSWTTFGMRCSIVKQTGTVKLSRHTSGGDWKVGDAQWGQTATAQPSHLRNLQLTLGGSQYGFSHVAGIPSALTSNARNLSATDVGLGFSIGGSEFAVEDTPIHFPDGLDWKVVADNILWTTMESQRMAYEAAAMNPSKASPESLVTISATARVQRYRITFVPVLLSAGLLSVFLAAIQAFGLMIHADRSSGDKMPEAVDSLRLVTDILEGLKDEITAIDVKDLPNKDLESWAKDKRVGYCDSTNDAGSETARLVLRGL